ncbi:MAG: helix-turn-helix domain-containing protein [Bdellovibrionota bacterium]|nr:MAG: helix-turn-helix domain-containing protein [Bdellovibrionota bacterium]
MNTKPILLTTNETVRILRVNRAKLYDLIKGRVIEAFKIGSDWRIRTESIERLCGTIIPDSFFDQPPSPRKKGGRPKLARPKPLATHLPRNLNVVVARGSI